MHRAPRCGARTRSGTPCRSPAMKNGRCRMHGGGSLGGEASPRYRHGLYTKGSLTSRRAVAALFAQSKRILRTASTVDPTARRAAARDRSRPGEVATPFNGLLVRPPECED
jgi:hypothetical protein